MRYLNPILILLPTLLFLLIGLRWLIEPAAVRRNSDLIWGKVWDLLVKLPVFPHWFPVLLPL